MFRLKQVWAVAAMTGAALLSSLPPAAAKPPMEAYANLPSARAAEISPDGSTLAYLHRDQDKDYLVIKNLETGKADALASVTDLKARSVRFAGNRYVILTASETVDGWRGDYDHVDAFAFDLKKESYVRLLDKTENLGRQAGGGRILAVDPSGDYVYMPHYMLRGGRAYFDVLKVSLSTGRGTRLARTQGDDLTIDWLVDDKGEAILREDYEDGTGRHLFRAPEKIGWKTLIEEDVVDASMMGIDVEGRVLMWLRGEDGDRAIFGLNTKSGEISPPLFQRPGADVEGVIVDNYLARGLAYSGVTPSYQMFDPALDADIKAAQAAIPGAWVGLDSASDDWSRVLLRAEGGRGAERYILLDRTKKTMSVALDARPEIQPSDVAEVQAIEYAARDSMKIPGILTWPPGTTAADRKSLPMVVMPHGGPRSYDDMNFDALAQMLANEGYLVLQPNFRGSSGFGEAFLLAGYGEWGRKMQDDISDGVKAAVQMGWADPGKVCIVGWSYGGYAALAGGALTPELYKCVASIAGVTDLFKLLNDTRLRNQHRYSYVYDDLVDLLGDPGKDRERIRAVSPVELADRFAAPVLLVHGYRDTVVEVGHSEKMRDVLKAAGKDVTYVRLEGDGHGLSDDKSRREAFGALLNFLGAHLGKPPAAPK
jgi:dienelactone hydrolase